MIIISTKISIIVPVYQAQAYIERCLDSLLKQNFTDFELLLIDDGSKDASGSICDGYAQNDSRIIVKHKSNEGVSKTRQYGLDLAVGEYVIFVDPDDWVEPDYLKVLYETAKSGDYDLVMCDFLKEFGNNNSVYCCQKPSSLDAASILEEMFTTLNGSTWNKLVRKDLYTRFVINFPEGINFCEDLYVTCSLLLKDIKVSYVNRALYHYDQIVNMNSIVRVYNEAAYERDKKVFAVFTDLFKRSKEPKNFRKAFVRLFVERAFWANVYNSKEFETRFARYSQVLATFSDIKGKMFYYSSIGYYRQVYYFALLCRKLKTMIR